MPDTRWSLASLLHPGSVTSFCAEHWGKAPLHVARDQPGYFGELIDLRDVERALSTAGALRLHEIDVLGDDWERGPIAPSSLSALYERMAAGQQLRIRRLETLLDPRAPAIALMDAIAASVRHPKSSLTCYVSGPAATSLGAHHDDVEIFSLQISGEKRWQLFDPIESARSSYRRDQLGPPRLELSMRPGDVLYLPRGTIHQVFSEAPSFSLAIALRPFTWSQLLEQLIQPLGASAELHELLPAGAELDAPAFAARFEQQRALIRAALDAMTTDEFRARLERQRLAGASLPAEPQLEHLFRLEQVALDTLLEKRPGIVLALTVDGAQLTLQLPEGQVLQAAAGAAPAFRMLLAQSTPFRVEAFSDALSPNAKLALAKRLIACGVLRFASPAETK